MTTMMQITELEVWKASVELAKRSFQIAAHFGEEGNSGLAVLLRRTVANIPANISIAASRKHGRESLKHLFRARDLIYEVESHVYLANRLGYISDEVLNEMIELLNTSKKLLFGFIKYYKRANYNDSKYRKSGRSKGPKKEEDLIIDEEDDEEIEEFDEDDEEEM